MENRDFNTEILKEIKERWSPRAFSDEKINDEDIMGILEAARYAPSCYNEQPWRFIVAKDKEKLEKMNEILFDGNKVWASKAPALILVLSKKTFERNGKDNYWHTFDAGTAWGYLSLEAQKRGLITHAMGGFNKNKAKEIYNISDDYSIITVIAVGKYGNKEDLPDNIKAMEKPSIRKPIEDLIIK
jgi:nitroreductase